MGNFESKCYYAAKSGSAPTLHQIRNDFINQFDVNKSLYDSLSLLGLTIKSNNIEAVQEILKFPNIDVNHPMGAGVTPIALAISTKNIEIVRLLLDHGALAFNKEKGYSINSPLRCVLQYYTSKDNYTEMVKLLIEHGAQKELTKDFIYWLQSDITVKNSAIFLYIKSFQI